MSTFPPLRQRVDLTQCFLITRASTPLPTPCIPHPSMEIALEKAKGMLAGCNNSPGIIIWAPVRLLTHRPAPIEITELPIPPSST